MKWQFLIQIQIIWIKKTHFNLVLKSSKLFSNSSSNKKKIKISKSSPLIHICLKVKSWSKLHKYPKIDNYQSAITTYLKNRKKWIKFIHLIIKSRTVTKFNKFNSNKQVRNRKNSYKLNREDTNPVDNNNNNWRRR